MLLLCIYITAHILYVICTAPLWMNSSSDFMELAYLFLLLNGVRGYLHYILHFYLKKNKNDTLQLVNSAVHLIGV